MYGHTEVEPSNLANDIPSMHECLHTLGVTIVHDAHMEEEQKREVSLEFEQELQLERPPQVQPAVHRLDKEVCNFVRKGTIPIHSNVFLPLMTPLHSKSDALNPPNPWSRRLLATRDFMTTMKDGNEESVLTDYLRPVNWIVVSVKSRILIMMSPFEVNQLLQDIRESKCICLHMYAPYTTQAMKKFEDLTFYCVLPLTCGYTFQSLDIRCQLNIWAGQLYLDQYEMYLRLCLLLGVSLSEKAGYSSMQSDRFVPKKGQIGEMVDACLFDESPLTLLKMLFGLRRKGMSYQQMHMGKILHAHLLSQQDFCNDLEESEGK